MTPSNQATKSPDVELILVMKICQVYVDIGRGNDSYILSKLIYTYYPFVESLLEVSVLYTTYLYRYIYILKHDNITYIYNCQTDVCPLGISTRKKVEGLTFFMSFLCSSICSTFLLSKQMLTRLGT